MEGIYPSTGRIEICCGILSHHCLLPFLVFRSPRITRNRNPGCLTGRSTRRVALMSCEISQMYLNMQCFFRNQQIKNNNENDANQMQNYVTSIIVIFFGLLKSNCQMWSLHHNQHNKGQTFAMQCLPDDRSHACKTELWKYIYIFFS